MSAQPTNPYVGLRPFESEDSDVFFGRTKQTTELLECLHSHRFLSVVGSSGCGKSSLIKAGLLPGLRGGFLVEDRDCWDIVSMNPGDSPLVNLAAGLEKTFPGLPEMRAAALEEEMKQGGVAALQARIEGAASGHASLLIFVDQFEEVFAFRGQQATEGEETLSQAAKQERTKRRQEAEDFVGLLLSLSKDSAHEVYVVTTMRSDFEGDCDVFYGLPEAMNRGRYLVPRLTSAQLEMAIKGPALLFGADMSKALLDLLRNELGDRFDRLPVLQHALRRTWEEWVKASGTGPITGPILVDHYMAAGTLEGALAKQAGELLDQLAKEPALAALTPEERELEVARVFQSLTDTDSLNRQIRRPARKSRIAAESGLASDRVALILGPFLSAGFVYAAGRKDDPRYSLSHESLIRQWVDLRKWVSLEREARDNFRELVQRADERKVRGLLRGPDLAFKRRWWRRRVPQGEWAERYIARSGAFADAKDYLDSSATWELIRKTALYASIGLALLVLGVVAAWAVNQRALAIDQKGIAESSLAEAKTLTNKLTASVAEAKANLDLAKVNEQKARAAQDLAEANLELATANGTKADQNAAKLGKALEEAGKNLQTALAETARADAALKVAQTNLEQRDAANNKELVARIVSGLGSNSPGTTYRELAENPEPIREAVLGRVLSNEGDAEHFLQGEPLAIGALLGATPRQRLGPMQRAFETSCINGYSDIAQGPYRTGVCSALMNEVTASGRIPASFSQRGYDLLAGMIAGQQFNGLSRAVGLFGPLLDTARSKDLSAALLQKPDSTSQVIVEWIYVAGSRLDPTVTQSLVAATAANRGLSSMTAAHFGPVARSLSPQQARNLWKSLSDNRFDKTISSYDAISLVWLAPFLTLPEVGEIRTALLAGFDPTGRGYDAGERQNALRRLAENLPPASLAAHHEAMLTWLNGQTPAAPFMIRSLAEAVQPGRSSLPSGRAAALLPNLLRAAAGPSDTDEGTIAWLDLVFAAGGPELLRDQTIPILRGRHQTNGIPPSSDLQFDRDFLKALGTQLASTIEDSSLQPETRDSIVRIYLRLAEAADESVAETLITTIPTTSGGSAALGLIAGSSQTLRARTALRRLATSLHGIPPNEIGNQLASAAIRSDLEDAPEWKPILDQVVGALSASSAYRSADGLYYLRLRPRASSEQARRAVQALLRHLPESAQELAAVSTDLTPDEARQVIQASRDTLSQIDVAGGSSWAFALGLSNLSQFQTPEQVRAIASRFPTNATTQYEGWYASALPEVLPVMTPELRALVFDSLLAEFKGGRSYVSPNVYPIIASVARALAPEQQKLLFEAAATRIEESLRQTNPYEASQASRAILSLVDLVSPADQARGADLIRKVLAASVIIPDPPYAKEVLAKMPELKEAVRSTLLRLIGGYSSRAYSIQFQTYIDLLRIIDPAPTYRQTLLGMTAIPGLPPEAATQLAVLLAQDAGLDWHSFLRERGPYARFYEYGSSWRSGFELDRWKLEDWVAGNGGSPGSGRIRADSK